MTSIDRRNVIVWVILAFAAGVLVGNLGAGLGGPGASAPALASGPVVPPPSAPAGQPAGQPAAAAGPVGTAPAMGSGPGMGMAPQAPAPAARLPRLRAATQAHPEDPGVWVALGNAYFDANQPPEAVKAYERALTLKPGDPNVLTDLGVMYRRLGQFQEAVARFQAAAAAAPTHVQSRYNLGVVYLHDLHDAARARAAWEGFLRVAGDGDPRAAAVRAQLADLGSGAGAP